MFLNSAFRYNTCSGERTCRCRFFTSKIQETRQSFILRAQNAAKSKIHFRAGSPKQKKKARHAICKANLAIEKRYFLYSASSKIFNFFIEILTLLSFGL